MEFININDLKDGDIAIYEIRPKFKFSSILALCVSIFTLSKIVHVGIVREINGELYLLEAQYPSVRNIPISQNPPTHAIKVRYSPDEYINGILDESIGKPYSIYQAICSVFGYYIDDDKWYCTEIAYEYIDAMGIKIDKDLRPGKFINNLSNKLNKKILKVEKD